MYDVIIVGAGAVGNYTAYLLAGLGYRVAVFEAKQAVGSNVCCTGIISRECYDLFCLPGSVVLREASCAGFFAPSGKSLKLEADKIQAYIVDRAAFDVALAKKAQEAGATYFLQSTVVEVAAGRKGCQVKVGCQGQEQTFEARAVVLACGFSSVLPERLGMGRIRNFLLGAQTEVSTPVSEVEVYFDQELAPGGFAWLVPTYEGRGLAGVLSRQNARACLKNLLSKLIAGGKIAEEEFDITQKAVPLGVLSRTYGERVLVVGEAAGQVKPTTGGGIYFGLLGAELAASTLHEALLANDLSVRRLSRYQKKWQAKIGYDLRMGYWARKIYSKINNGRIERLFDVVASRNIYQELLNSESFSFDWHGRLISEVLKQPGLLGSLIPPVLCSISGIQALFSLLWGGSRKER